MVAVVSLASDLVCIRTNKLQTEQTNKKRPPEKQTKLYRLYTASVFFRVDFDIDPTEETIL